MDWTASSSFEKEVISYSTPRSLARSRAMRKASVSTETTSPRAMRTFSCAWAAGVSTVVPTRTPATATAAAERRKIDLNRCMTVPPWPAYWPRPATAGEGQALIADTQSLTNCWLVSPLIYLGKIWKDVGLGKMVSELVDNGGS